MLCQLESTSGLRAGWTGAEELTHAPRRAVPILHAYTELAERMFNEDALKVLSCF